MHRHDVQISGYIESDMDPPYLRRQVWSLGVTFYHMLVLGANLGKTTKSVFGTANVHGTYHHTSEPNR